MAAGIQAQKIGKELSNTCRCSKKDDFKMTQDDMEMIEKIMDSENMGYAYLYPADGSETKSYLVSTQPRSIAAFVNCYKQADMRIVITDMAERSIIEVYGAKIEKCADSKLESAIADSLSLGGHCENQRERIPAVPKEAADQYFFEEDQAVTVMEAGML